MVEMDAKVPTEQVIRDAVTLACRAPSLHNSQPWRWVADGTRLHLWADPRHAMHATDHTGRELILSCGAVLDHLRVAMAAAGWDSVTERFPTEGRPDHLASVGFLPVANVTPQCRLRADAILRRSTDRLPLGAPPAWPTLHSALSRAVTPYDVTLDVVDDDERPRLAEASRLTEQLRRSDTSYLTELRWWTSPFEADADHVPETALLSSSEAARVDIARAFPPAGGGRRRASIEVDHSKIVVLSTHGDAPAEVLRCGEALSAVLLECTLAGLATCTLTHMTELSLSRDIIRQITGSTGQPQLLIRVGRSPSKDPLAKPTARRPVTEVLEMRG
nr:NAD(P)H nitroreductase [Mycobacterium paraffinicum]